MRSLLCFGLALGLTSLAAAQVPTARRVAVWSASASELSGLERGALRVARAALPGAPNTESACEPSDTGCVTSMLRGTSASHLLAIHVHWGRGGCAPVRRDGAIVGTRMRMVRVVDLDLYAADGTLLGNREVRVASETDIAPIEAALAELLAL